jgi:predicted 2-oxoglutarate/Fe(II)-dependent dioxygenase YbiX
MERKNISIHTDANLLSINILLSDPNNFTGGEFYIFDSTLTKKYLSLYENVLSIDEEEKERFVNSFETLPIVDMKQGDCIMYEGLKHLHGVLPVKTGQRYIISFFFDRA